MNTWVGVPPPVAMGLPPLVAGNPKMRWGRLSVLLQILTELTADTWGNPRQIYSKVQGC